ncbi:hypothetical protein BDB00DRAFT_155185 [Zychaea mexicana]|uniref:uncharacterized protein n=1 Tax=Zychaea mexicana TaxID=64656 RepID=UPI0022FEDE09|nr:uncharacterized protein BDB00DRAFT_155185 [Zychaea mexicana]KAI9484316.1 hypothetical protein BDB00DRAFT_155185 [Zychaea mexicana]
MQNRSDQLENGELPVAQPLLSGQQQTNKDHSRLRSASSPSRSPDHHGGRLSSGLSYVPRPRELDSRRDDYYRGESSTRDPHYYYSDELRDTSRGDHYGGRRESSRDDYYERRRESSRGGDRHDGRRESSRDDFYEKRRESSLDDYYGRGREPRRDDPYEERREPRLASTSSSLMPASVPFTSNAAVAAVAAAPMATTNTTITTAPQPASTRGMTGTNLIPLATRKAPKTIVDTGKVMPTKKTTTVSAAATTTATTTSVTAAATNETGEKRATQPNGAQT